MRWYYNISKENKNIIEKSKMQGRELPSLLLAILILVGRIFA
jgi:hypothetical protein